MRSQVLQGAASSGFFESLLCWLHLIGLSVYHECCVESVMGNALAIGVAAAFILSSVIMVETVLVYFRCGFTLMVVRVENEGLCMSFYMLQFVARGLIFARTPYSLL